MPWHFLILSHRVTCLLLKQSLRKCVGLPWWSKSTGDLFLKRDGAMFSEKGHLNRIITLQVKKRTAFKWTAIRVWRCTFLPITLLILKEKKSKEGAIRIRPASRKEMDAGMRDWLWGAPHNYKRNPESQRMGFPCAAAVKISKSLLWLHQTLQRSSPATWDTPVLATGKCDTWASTITGSCSV